MRIESPVNFFIDRKVRENQNRINKSFERLSSGLRINRAADDAAGLAISETSRARSNGLEQANKNIQDGISLIQTADGALSEVSGMLQRMRKLLLQASSDTVTDSERHDAIFPEMKALGDEIQRISDTASFNDKIIFGQPQETLGARNETYFPVQPSAQNDFDTIGSRDVRNIGNLEVFRPGVTQIGSAGAATGVTDTVNAVGQTDAFPFGSFGVTDAFANHGTSDVFNSAGTTEPTTTPGVTESSSRGATEAFTRGRSETFNVANPATDNVLTLAVPPEDYNPALNGSELIILNGALQLSQNAGDYTIAGNTITIDSSLLSAGDQIEIRYIGTGENTFTLGNVIEDYGAGNGSEVVRLEGVQLTRGVDYDITGAGDEITLIGNSRLVGNDNGSQWQIEIEYVAQGGNTISLANLIEDYAAPPVGSEEIFLTGETIGGANDGSTALVKGVDYVISGGGDEITLIGNSRLVGNNGAAVGVNGHTVQSDYLVSGDNTIALTNTADPNSIEVRVDGALMTNGTDYVLQNADTEVRFIGASRLVGRQNVDIQYIQPGDEVFNLTDTPLDFAPASGSEEVRVDGVLQTRGVEYNFSAPNQITFVAGALSGDPDVSIEYLTAAESNVLTLSNTPLDYAPGTGSEVVTVDGAVQTRGVDYNFSAPNEITFVPGRLTGQNNIQVEYVDDVADNDIVLTAPPVDYNVAPNLADSEIVTVDGNVYTAGADYEFVGANTIRFLGASRLKGGEDVTVEYTLVGDQTLNLTNVPDAGTLQIEVEYGSGTVTLGAGDWNFVPGPGPSTTVQINDNVLVGDPVEIRAQYQNGAGFIDFASAPLDYDPDPQLAGSERFFIDGVEQTAGVDYVFTDADTIQVLDITRLAGNPVITLEYPDDPGDNTLSLAAAPEQYAGAPGGSEVVDVTAGVVLGPPPAGGVLTKGVEYTVAGNQITLTGSGRLKGNPEITVGYIPTGGNNIQLSGTPLDYNPAQNGSENVVVDGGAPLSQNGGAYTLNGDTITLLGGNRLVGAPHTVTIDYVTTNELVVSPVANAPTGPVPGFIVDGSATLRVNGVVVPQDPVNGWSLTTTVSGSTNDFVNPDTGENFVVDRPTFDFRFQLNGTSRLVGDNGGAGHTVEVDYTFNPHEEYQLNVPPGTRIVGETVTNIFEGNVNESTIDGYEIAQTRLPEDRFKIGDLDSNFLLFHEQTTPFIFSSTEITYDFVTAVEKIDQEFIIHVGADGGEILSLDIPQWDRRTLGIEDVDLTDRETAEASIALVDGALQQISEMRTSLGSQENRLVGISKFNSQAMINESAARSRIRDADFADEVVTLARRQILSQAGIAAMSQSRISSQSVLQLLG